MNLTNAELQELIELKKIQNSDDIRYKQIIKEKLLNNNKIIYALHNTELEEMNAPNDEYFGINIKDYYIIPEIQSRPMNYLCYEVSFNDVSNYNKVIKIGQVIFYICCEVNDIRDKYTGIARHDLIASILTQDFNWSNCFGNQFRLVQDKAGVLDTNYCLRTLIFEGDVTNSLSNNPKVNKGVEFR